MRVILKEEVDNLGEIGAIVKVAPGYARNYLIPKGLAAVADTRNVKAFEHEKRIILRRAEKVRAANMAVSEKISAVKVTLSAKAGAGGKLFGSITAMDIAGALNAQGLEVEKRKIVIQEPIKKLGSHTVTVKVAANVTASVTVEVEPAEGSVLDTVVPPEPEAKPEAAPEPETDTETEAATEPDATPEADTDTEAGAGE